ncbi:hypothetical protein ACWOFR_07705 [Carnobacterium gallinarum]|uniref:hypothetical protein n=1 Tax=Carnobacterium gallinarum TaxID=2749 RepID=UPI0005578157|nr:hypothetical protein [Carnobacterium gallinarum]
MIFMKQKRNKYKLLFSLLVVILLIGVGCGKTATKKVDTKKESITSELVEEKVKVETNAATIKVQKNSESSSGEESSIEK